METGRIASILQSEAEDEAEEQAVRVDFAEQSQGVWGGNGQLRLALRNEADDRAASLDFAERS